MPTPTACDRGCAPPPTLLGPTPHLVWHDRIWIHPPGPIWPPPCRDAGDQRPGCQPAPARCHCGADYELLDTGRPRPLVTPPARDILRSVA